MEHQGTTRAFWCWYLLFCFGSTHVYESGLTARKYLDIFGDVISELLENVPLVHYNSNEMVPHQVTITMLGYWDQNRILSFIKK